MGMQYSDDGVAFWIYYENHAIHPLPIGSRDAVSQSIKLSTTHHK
jgi:hypothetical protein